MLPEGVEEEDLLEWVEDNFTTLFESQLSAWTEDESAWPASRDLKTFREWFRVDLHGVVVDIADDEIEGRRAIEDKSGQRTQRLRSCRG